MKKFSFLFAIFISTFLFSQTKLIAFKSHSGNMNHFETSVSKNFFDVNESNLGNPPITKVMIDSVIILEGNKAVVKSNRENWNQNGKGDRRIDTIALKNFKKKKTYNDSLKLQVNEEMYNRSSWIAIKNDSTVYLQYNSKTKTYKKLEKEKPKPQIKKSEIKKESLIKNGLIILVFIISGFIALHSWRKNRRHES